MISLSLHGMTDAVTGAVFGASLIYRLLPPPEKFNDWPRFQGWYKFTLIFLGYIAFNKNGNGKVPSAS